MAPVSQQKLRKNLVKFWERISEVESPLEFARRRRGWFKGTEFVGRFETGLLGNGGGEVTHEKARKISHRLSLLNLGWSNSELMHHVEYLVPNHLFDKFYDLVRDEEKKREEKSEKKKEEDKERKQKRKSEKEKLRKMMNVPVDKKVKATNRNPPKPRVGSRR